MTESSKFNINFFPSFIQGNQKYSDLFDFKCKLSGEKHYEENRKKIIGEIIKGLSLKWMHPSKTNLLVNLFLHRERVKKMFQTNQNQNAIFYEK